MPETKEEEVKEAPPEQRESEILSKSNMKDRDWTWVLLMRGGSDFMCQINVKNIEKLPETFRARRAMDVMDFPDPNSPPNQPPRVISRIVPMATLKKLCIDEGVIYRDQVAQIWPLKTKVAQACQVSWDAFEKIEKEMEDEKKKGPKPKLAIVTGKDAERVLDAKPMTAEQEQQTLNAIASMMARKSVGGIGRP